MSRDFFSLRVRPEIHLGIAGFFTFLPGRVMHAVAFGH